MYGYASSAPAAFQAGYPQQQQQPMTMYGQRAIQMQQQLQYQQQQGWQQQAGYQQQHFQQQQQYPQQAQYPQQGYGGQPLSNQPGFQQRSMQQATQASAAAAARAATPAAAAAAARATTPKAGAPATGSKRPSKRAKREMQQARAQGAQQQQQQEPAAQAAAGLWLDKLRDDIMQFTQQALPSPKEQQERQAALTGLTAAVHAALGNRGINVMLFGSSRAGLATHSSDMDIMITGLCEPTAANGGYERQEKMQVSKYLRKVEREACRRLAVQKRLLISGARIPLLKLVLRNGLEMDVSLNNTAGISAANFLHSWQQDFCALQPLVLVLKSVLKENGLGDVATGGLGSWSLSNMAIAHLMAEESAGGQVDHVGHMLLSFLKRFGIEWDINRDAVAVGQGGIVKRAAIGMVGGQDKLAVKDPLTGREVAGGSHRYADVAELWGHLYVELATKGPQAAARAGAGSSQLSSLGVILNCNAVLQRAGAAAARAPYNGGHGGGSNQGYGVPQGGSLKRQR